MTSWDHEYLPNLLATETTYSKTVEILGISQTITKIILAKQNKIEKPYAAKKI